MEIDFIRASILALIQGVTEFLPISSSAHLIIPASMFGWEDQGLAFDVAVHFGSLFAVVVYFRKEIFQIIGAWGLHILKQEPSEDARLGWMIILATCPIVLAGLFLRDIIDTYFRNTTLIASTTIIFALLLWFADKRDAEEQDLKKMGWQSFLLIGLAQVLALLPGTSRSGVTMTAGLFCKLNRRESAHFSFLLAIPAVAGATLLSFLDLLGESAVNWSELLYGWFLAAVFSFLCIHYFLKLVTTLGYLPFVVYRVLLGLVLFVFFV